MKRTPLVLVVMALFFIGHAQATTPPIYVAPPPTGNDMTGDGSSAHPYATPNKARQVVSVLTCAQKPVTVYFASGFYPLSSAWTFTSADSGCSATQTVTYTANPSATTTPIISGGVMLTTANGFTWTNVSGTLWKVTLPASITGYSPDALYYNGTRRFRARPGAVSGSGLTGLVGAYNKVACSSSPSCPTTFTSFKYTAGDPPDQVATWTNYAAWNVNSACTNSGNASQNGDIEILIFEKWTMSRQRIACINTTTKTVYVTGSTLTDGNHGFMNGHRYLIENVSTGTSNLIASQFFIDRTTTPYTLYYKAASGETPGTDSIVIPVLAPSGTAGAILSATSLQYVTFSNLQFSHDNYVPPTAGFGAKQSNVNLPAAVTCMNCSNTTWTGDFFTATTANALALETNSTASATLNSITLNNFYDLGADGLVYGNLPASGDTPTNILTNGTIEENLVQGYGRMYAGASGIEHPFGSDTSIQNNDVTDGYNTGIGVCVPIATLNCGGTGTAGAAANNILGDFNHVWNIGKGVTDDMGAFYIATFQATGNEVKNNRLHDVQDAQPYDSDGYGGNGIYLDNNTGNIMVKNNLVYRVSEHAVQNTSGPPGCSMPNTIVNNILAYGRTGMFNEGGASGVQPCLTETLQNNIFYFDRTDTSTCGIGQDTAQCTFFVPSGCTIQDPSPTAQDWIGNLYFNTTPSSTWGTTYAKAFFTITSTGSCGTRKFYTFPAWQTLGEDNGSAVFNPNFINPTCTFNTATACWSHHTQDNYQITGLVAGQTLTISSGQIFTAFSMSAPGRQSPAFTPSAILDTFPTTTFDTTTTAGNF